MCVSATLEHFNFVVRRAHIEAHKFCAGANGPWIRGRSEYESEPSGAIVRDLCALPLHLSPGVFRARERDLRLVSGLVSMYS